MVPDKVIYTDGHGVTVTDSNLKVKEKVYSLRGIIHHGFWTIKASRLPGILLIVLGLMSVALGILEMVSPFIPDMALNANSISSNTVAVWLGIVFIALGIVWIAAAKERYAVRISTAEGERNAVVSQKKEYISQIVTAINEAFKVRRDISVE